jgi:hypothetical protein
MAVGAEYGEVFQASLAFCVVTAQWYAMVNLAEVFEGRAIDVLEVEAASLVSQCPRP